MFLFFHNGAVTIRTNGWWFKFLFPTEPVACVICGCAYTEGIFTIARNTLRRLLLRNFSDSSCIFNMAVQEHTTNLFVAFALNYLSVTVFSFVIASL